MELKNLAKAVLQVMIAVKGIDKTMTVGSGNNAYKGVPDQEVKKIIGESMAKNGLTIMPIDIDAKTQIDRWEATGGQYGPVQKQSVFTEVKTKYLLLHESGESQIISGYGHGVDPQDKGAGKATTYALKYALLYLFLVPTGKIDDSDVEHSENKDVPRKPIQKIRPELNPDNEKWQGAIRAIIEGKTTIDKIEAAYSITPKNRELLLSQAI